MIASIRKGIVLAALALGVLFVTQKDASAADMGVGAAAMLAQPIGNSPMVPAAQFLVDSPTWHFEALFGASTRGNTRFIAGGRFWFHLHQSAAADFSLGGGLGISHFARPSPGSDISSILLEAGAQMRAFIVSNVALSATVGLGVRAGDDNEDGVAIGGQLVSGIGLTYLFR